MCKDIINCFDNHTGCFPWWQAFGVDVRNHGILVSDQWIVIEFDVLFLRSRVAQPISEIRRHAPRGEGVSPGPLTGVNHNAVQVDNIDALYEKLKASVVSFHAPPTVSTNGVAKVTYFRDPESAMIELVEMLRPS